MLQFFSVLSMFSCLCLYAFQHWQFKGLLFLLLAFVPFPSFLGPVLQNKFKIPFSGHTKLVITSLSEPRVPSHYHIYMKGVILKAVYELYMNLGTLVSTTEKYLLY